MTMGHHRLTDREKNFIWRSWQKRLTCEAIGGKIGKNAASVFFYLQKHATAPQEPLLRADIFAGFRKPDRSESSK